MLSRHGMILEAKMKNGNAWFLKFFAVIVLAVAIPVLCHDVSYAAVTDPVVVIKDAVDEIISILQDEKLGVPNRKAERKSRVVTIVEKKFDFREMSMRTLAKH